MATKVQKSVVVSVPVETAYNQWTQFEEFPHFMGGISEVRQLDDTTLVWVAEIAGVKRKWKARILEQVPNEKIAWAATTGATNAGAVYFSPVGAGQTNVRLELEYEPKGLIDKAADKVGVIGRRADADLSKFKSFIEDAGYATGAWRGAVPGAVGTPGVEAAQSSRGDSGKAGVEKKVVAGAAAAAAGVAAAAKAKAGKSQTIVEPVDTETVVVDTDIAATPPLSDTAVPRHPRLVDPEARATPPVSVDPDPSVNGDTASRRTDKPSGFLRLMPSGW